MLVAGLDSQPTVDTTVIDSQPLQKLPSALADIWKRYKSKYIAHVTVLEQYITALVADTLTKELEQQAQASVHLLIGSLASFGFTEASRLSREIEQIFRAGVKQSPTQAERLSQLVVALQHEMEQDQMSHTSYIMTHNQPSSHTEPQPPQEAEELILKLLPMLDNRQLWSILERIAQNLSL